MAGPGARQLSTGGKQKLSSVSKIGERTLRRLFIIGSSTVVQHASTRGAAKGSWFEGMIARKPRMLVTVALANKTARIVWALITKQKDHRAHAMTAWSHYRQRSSEGVSVEGGNGGTAGETEPEELG